MTVFPLRITPGVVLLGARRPQRMLERSAMVYRRSWMVIVSGFFEPLFYLLAIRVGLSRLVGDVTVGGRVIDYAEFVAPALMASAAMNGAVNDATYNVYVKLRYSKTYDSVLATPMSPGDVALGEIGFAVTRGLLYSCAFLATMAVLGMTASWWVLLAVPISALIGFAFAAVGMAATTYLRSFFDFDYIQTVTVPLFVLSATFYPVSSYGDWGWIVQLSPLYHGIALLRAANAGVFEWSMFGHIAFLAAMAAAGLAVAARRVNKILLP